VNLQESPPRLSNQIQHKSKQDRSLMYTHAWRNKNQDRRVTKDVEKGPRTLGACERRGRKRQPLSGRTTREGKTNASLSHRVITSPLLLIPSLATPLPPSGPICIASIAQVVLICWVRVQFYFRAVSAGGLALGYNLHGRLIWAT
jgi:hypothetical protein